ncbi:retropepsin-like aspartic protease family protein [Roseovarius salinarum]|jgi:aspartyl protease family protein|uniref:retropepsin-like aspartic protease family protein n=1 Tax=Roseovarius salinarum TaxID=1981892 RepID=UPI000C330DDC|nr:TIGR02281 family clan AA aspartic protease [Roseovarius salinarum]
MNDFDTAQLIYLVVLGTAIVLIYVTHHRGSLGRMIQQAMIWALIFVGVIAAVGLWGDIRQGMRPGQAVMTGPGKIELPRAPDGHYYVTAQVNGAPVRFVVDTGASQIVLSKSAAREAGIDPDGLAYVDRAYTANGEVRTAPVNLGSFEIGPMRDTGLRAWVNEGRMDQSLLGMSYLQRFESVEIANGKLVLTR